MEEFSTRLKKALSIRNMKQSELSRITGIDKSLISNYISGRYKAKSSNLYLIAVALNVSEAWLMGYDVDMERKEPTARFPAPQITDQVATFPVIGDVAAGYDELAIENWDGDLVEIPLAYLHGRPQSDFFVLVVRGDSMYPQYQNGDKVLIQKCDTLDYSGQIGVVIYDDEIGTLKRVEYAAGENWLRLVPINPEYPPKTITGEALDHCRVIGKPVLIIREIQQ